MYNIESETIYGLCVKVRRIEREKLEEVFRSHVLGDNKEATYAFPKDERPVISAYDCDEPADMVVTEVKYSETGYLSIVGYPKNGYSDDITEIEFDDIALGHLEFVADQLKYCLNVK
ncbi:MAG: hypothetical protein K5854_01640 [Prevotella sp.]|nr:hypothetical protein [Prevotella sp.]